MQLQPLLFHHCPQGSVLCLLCSFLSLLPLLYLRSLSVPGLVSSLGQSLLSSRLCKQSLMLRRTQLFQPWRLAWKIMGLMAHCPTHLTHWISFGDFWACHCFYEHTQTNLGLVLWFSTVCSLWIRQWYWGNKTRCCVCLLKLLGVSNPEHSI